MTDYTVRFRGENRSAVRAARETDREVGRLSGSLRRSGTEFRRSNAEMGKMTRGALAGSGAFGGFARSIAFASTAFLGGAGLTFALRGAIKGASDLSEEINKSKVVFGSASQIILRWSQGTAVSLGIARAEALKFAGTFGNMLVPMGFARDEASKMSKGLVNLAADMASFNNAAPVEVLEALRAGLAGETEPLRRFGVFLNEARIAATAASLGLSKTTADMGKVSEAETRLSIARANHAKALRDYGARSTQAASASLAVSSAERGITSAMKGSKTQLTAQAKAAAIYKIILKDTKDAQGDVARTSNSWANVQRRLKAVIIETQTAIGQGLLPILAPLLRRFTAYVVTLQKGGKNHERFKEILAQSISTIRTTAGMIGRLARFAKAASDAVGGWDNTFKIILAGVLTRQVWKLAAAFTALGGGGAAAGAGAATGLALANVRAARLAGLLKRIKGFGIIAVAIEVAVNWDEINSFDKWRKDLSAKGGSGIPRWVPGSGSIFDRGPDKQSPDRTDAYRWGQTQRANNPNMNERGLVRSLDRSPYARDAAARRQAHKGFRTPALARDPRLGGVFGGSRTSGSGVQLPTQHRKTHDTAGLSGYPAVDYFGSPGTPVLAPEDGRVYRHSGRGGTSGQIYGVSLYFAGSGTGNDYFITHLAKVAPIGSYKKGAVIGTIGAWTGGAPHAHVGIRGSGGRTSYTPPPPPGGTTPGGGTGGTDLTVGTSDTKPKAPSGPDPAAIRDTRRTVTFIRSNLARVIPPGLRKRISSQVGSILDLLTGKVTTKEFSDAGKRFTALRSLWGRSLDLSEAIRGVRKTVKSVSALIERMPTDVRGKLRNQMGALQRDLGNVMTQAGLKRIKERLEKISEAIEAAIEKAREKVDAAREGIATAFGRIAERALEVFDAQTDEMVQKARGAFEAMTAAESSLAALRARRSAVSSERSIGDAEDKLARAMRLGDPGMIREAQRELEDARLDAVEAALEAQAAIEREAADAAADAEERRIRDERRIRREGLERRLEDVAEILDDEKLTTAEKMDKIRVLLEDYGISFEDAGRLVGNAFANAFRDEIDRLGPDLEFLLDLLDQVRRALGQAPIARAPIGRRAYHRRRGEDEQGNEMATGGLVMRPTRALVGEAGREAVIPLDDPRSLAMIREAIGGGGGGTVVHLNVEGSVVHERDLWREGAREIERVLSRNAQPGLAIRTSSSSKLGQRRQ